MRSWAQRTARWTVKTLPLPLRRPGGEPGGGDEPSGVLACPRAEPRAAEHGSRHRATNERGPAAPARGRHAAPRPSRKGRGRDAG